MSVPIEIASPEFIREAMKAPSGHSDVTVGAIDFLSDIVADRREPLMYLHPLKFLCLPMHRSDEFGLCVHVWMIDAPLTVPTTSEIHLHTFDLHSQILCG